MSLSKAMDVSEPIQDPYDIKTAWEIVYKMCTYYQKLGIL